LQKQYAGHKGIYLFAFTNEMGKIYNCASLAIARAGALTLAELENKKIPAILIPLPTAAANHQYYNAREQEEKKIARLVAQKNLNPDLLWNEIDSMKRNLSEYRSHFAQNPAIPAAQMIAGQILKDLK
jgi:UDP-N-acetylglucosamine--N-acetylmuramyl-(pentapeptide) pyrophosphoryl-undecaprenol N-acetylglucosamine transferase